MPPEPPEPRDTHGPRRAFRSAGGRDRPGLLGVLGLPVSRTARREAAYSVLTPLPGVVCGAVLLALLAASLVASVTQVGLILLVGVLTVARGVGVLHRALLRGLLGERIAAPPKPGKREKPGTQDKQGRRGLVATIRSVLTDSDGWRAAAFAVAYVPLGLLLLVMSVGVRLYGLAALAYPLWWRALENDGGRGLDLVGDISLDTWPRAVLTSLAGVGVLAFSAWSTRGLLTLVVRPLARALLGPPRLSDRVHVLEETRALAVQDSAATLRRIERDLHDGAQSRLTAVAIALAGARDQLALAPGESPHLSRARTYVDTALDGSATAIEELRDLVRGIHPPALNSGLDVALETLAARAGLPVTTRLDLPFRPPEALESIAYFCAAELLANAARHAGATRAEVVADEKDGVLRLTVRDDGRGGARPRPGDDTGAGGSGLAGLAERVSTVDGRLTVDSPAGGPTAVTTELPLPQALQEPS